MHYTNPPPRRYQLIRWDQAIIKTFDTIEEVGKYFTRRQWHEDGYVDFDNLGIRLEKPDYALRLYKADPYEYQMNGGVYTTPYGRPKSVYMVVDYRGHPVSPKVIAEYARHAEKNRQYRWQNQEEYWYRYDSVPRIGRCRRSGGCRRMKTTQERRENDFLDHYDEDARDYCIRSRRSRTLHGLPNSWEDYWVYSQKTWKKHRATQYRAK